LNYSINSFVNWIVQYMWTRLSGHGDEYEWMILGNMVQSFIEQHGVRTSAMV
jgi:hypothetical protein